MSLFEYPNGDKLDRVASWFALISRARSIPSWSSCLSCSLYRNCLVAFLFPSAICNLARSSKAKHASPESSADFTSPSRRLTGLSSNKWAAISASTTTVIFLYPPTSSRRFSSARRSLSCARRTAVFGLPMGLFGPGFFFRVLNSTSNKWQFSA